MQPVRPPRLLWASLPGPSVQLTRERPKQPCSDDVTGAPTGPATVSAIDDVLWQGAGRRFGRLCRLLSVPAHLRPAPCAELRARSRVATTRTPWGRLATVTSGRRSSPRALRSRGRGSTRPSRDGDPHRLPLAGVSSVQQVTYAGQPLYRFFLDQAPGDTQGANLDDPVTSPPGIWYLVDPSSGHPATGRAQLQLETAPVGGTGPDETVLAVTMNNDFSALPRRELPRLHLEHGPWPRAGACQRPQCVRGCVPCTGHRVLTSEQPVAGPGVDQHALGIIVRPDGSHQVTYNGQPLYLFVRATPTSGHRP